MIAEQGAARTLKHAALRRMVLEKNRAKGQWSGLSRLQLIKLARRELDEAEQAIEQAEGREREEAELGDAAAFLAMALHVGKAGCCCAGSGDDHDVCCPGWGWFTDDDGENGRVERCDECGIFESDEEAAQWLADLKIDPETGEQRA